MLNKEMPFSSIISGVQEKDFSPVTVIKTPLSLGSGLDTTVGAIYRLADSSSASLPDVKKIASVFDQQGQPVILQPPTGVVPSLAEPTFRLDLQTHYLQRPLSSTDGDDLSDAQIDELAEETSKLLGELVEGSTSKEIIDEAGLAQGDINDLADNAKGS